jgi:hypothetical protein
MEGILKLLLFLETKLTNLTLSDRSSREQNKNIYMILKFLATLFFFIFILTANLSEAPTLIQEGDKDPS